MKVNIGKAAFRAGSMYVENFAAIREQLIGLLEEGMIHLTVTLSGLDYVGSSELGVLISIHKRCLQKGGKMVVTGLRGMVEALFKRTRLDLVFNITNS